MEDSEIDNLNLVEVKQNHFEIKSSIKFKWLQQIEFEGYIFFSMIIHVFMLAAGKMLIIAEWIKNKIQNKLRPSVDR